VIFFADVHQINMRFKSSIFYKVLCDKVFTFEQDKKVILKFFFSYSKDITIKG